MSTAIPTQQKTLFNLPDEKQCRDCLQTLSVDNFYITKTQRFMHICKVCASARTVAWGKRNRDRKNAHQRTHARRKRERSADGELCTRCLGPADGEYKQCEKCRTHLHSYRVAARDRLNEDQRRNARQLKDGVFAAYGGYVCVCCGETHQEFLTIDHVNGDGATHRREVKDVYRWLRSKGYPSGFQVLCYNCNIGRHRTGGICPHKMESQNASE